MKPRLLIAIFCTCNVLPVVAEKPELKIPDTAAEINAQKAPAKVVGNSILQKKIAIERDTATHMRYEKRCDEAEKILRELCAEIA